MVRAAHADGTREMVATPHVSLRYPSETRDIPRLVAELGARLAAEAIDLKVLADAEVAATHTPDIDPAQLTRLRLGEGP